MTEVPIEVNEKAILISPSSWSPEQIKRFERMWNELIANGPMEHIKILPADKTIVIANTGDDEHA